MAMSHAISEQVLLNEINGKNNAIHAYDKIVWQIRTGFLTLVFGGWAFIIKGAIVSGKSFHDISEYISVMAVFSFLLSISGYIIDRNYIRRKFRVINALNGLQKLIINPQKSLTTLSSHELNEITSLIGVVGDSGNDQYKSKGYQIEVNVSLLIYPIIGLACLGIWLYIAS